MDDCLFCKIAAGELLCHNVYEDDYFLAFLDIRPLNPGHVILIPKRHSRWVWDLPTDRQILPNIGAYYEVAAKIANAQKRVFSTDYIFSLVMGQEVPHAHIHLLPHFPDDGHDEGVNLKNVKDISKEEMVSIAEKIRQAIK